MRDISYKSERDVKKQVKKLLTDHKWFWWMPSANGYGTQGVSDIIAFRAGVLLCAETKFGKNKHTAMQKAFLESIAAESGFGFIINEKNLPAFAEFLIVFDRSCQGASEGEKVADEDGATMLQCLHDLTEMVVS
jgi:hypothetical protein